MIDSMMHSPLVLLALMVFLVLVAGAAFVAVRLLAAHDDNRDHPH